MLFQRSNGCLLWKVRTNFQYSDYLERQLWGEVHRWSTVPVTACKYTWQEILNIYWFDEESSSLYEECWKMTILHFKKNMKNCVNDDGFNISACWRMRALNCKHCTSTTVGDKDCEDKEDGCCCIEPQFDIIVFIIDSLFYTHIVILTWPFKEITCTYELQHPIEAPAQPLGSVPDVESLALGVKKAISFPSRCR